MRRSSSFLACCWAAFLLSAPVASAAITIQIVADNDFALYAGDETSITREVYQNGVIWNNQLSSAMSFTFELEPGESYFYLLAMGGGNEENISGKINGVNIVKIYQDDSASVIRSNAIDAFLSSYDIGDASDGSYTPTLDSAKFALGQAIWGAPEVVTGATVINANPEAEINGQRYGFNGPLGQAVFYRFSAESVGIPEPGVSTLLGLGVLFVLARRLR